MLSHQLRRLQQRGLIERARGEGGDGRSAVIVLTDAGRRAYRSALGPHLRSAQHWFLDGIAPEQLDDFDTTLTGLLEHVQQLAAQRAIAKE